VLQTKLGLPREKPLLACASPPGQNTYGRRDWEFSDDLGDFGGPLLGGGE